MILQSRLYKFIEQPRIAYWPAIFFIRSLLVWLCKYTPWCLLKLVNALVCFFQFIVGSVRVFKRARDVIMSGSNNVHMAGSAVCLWCVVLCFVCKMCRVSNVIFLLLHVAYVLRYLYSISEWYNLQIGDRKWWHETLCSSDITSRSLHLLRWRNTNVIEAEYMGE
jgi:hypothetical protein